MPVSVDVTHVISPDVKIVEKIIMEFIEKTKDPLILIERLDYLISKTEFSEVLKFVQRLNSLTYVTNSFLLLQIDPFTIDEKDLRMLEKEAEVLEKKKIDLSEDLYEILEYVNRMNSVGSKPSLGEISEKFRITRNTTSKRVNQLRFSGLIVIKKRGRQRVLEITKKGEEYLF